MYTASFKYLPTLCAWAKGPSVLSWFTFIKSNRKSAFQSGVPQASEYVPSRHRVQL